MTDHAPQSDKTGVFITFEGGDGTGKSTQVKKLVADLTARGLSVIATREPGGTPQAERIRNLLLQRDSGNFDPLTEVLLLMAARREHLQNLIEPALVQEQWVISDRFVDSSRAFQGAGMGIDRAIIDQVYGLIAGDRMPDLTFVFDIDPAEGLARSGRQKAAAASTAEGTEDRYERMGLPFHTRLREGFLTIAREEPARCVLIDASQSIDAVTAQVMAEIQRRFGAQLPASRSCA